MKNSTDIKKQNKNTVRRLLYDGNPHSKQSIAAALGLSVSTCNTILNEMSEDGEIIGEKKQIHDVGPKTMIYSLNEKYEQILCLSFEVVHDKKELTLSVLALSGSVLYQKIDAYSTLEASTILSEITAAIARWNHITQIVIATSSVADHGIIRYCDIPELDDCAIVKILQEAFDLPVYLENDMHLKVYGYSKKHESSDAVVTLENFPSGALPAVANIQRGFIIKGGQNCAGINCYIPLGFSRDEFWARIKSAGSKFCLSMIEQVTLNSITMFNPDIILLTGSLLSQNDLDEIRSACLRTIPAFYMPELLYLEDLNDLLLEGLYQTALDKRDRL